MATAKFAREPFQVSSRFYRALQAKAIALETAASNDEIFAASLHHPDHLRRQWLLIQAQRDEAERLRDFLTRTIMQTTPSVR